MALYKKSTYMYIVHVYRGSYMSAHVLLNLLNNLRKRDKMRGIPRILSLFYNKFNKFNNTGAQMLDSIYYMTLKLFWNLISAVNITILSLCTQRCYGRFPKICKPLVVLSILMHGIISLPDATSCDKDGYQALIHCMPAHK